MALLINSSKHFKKEVISVLHNIFQRIENETVSTLFYETSMTSKLLKSNENIIKKKLHSTNSYEYICKNIEEYNNRIKLFIIHLMKK